MTDLRMLGQLLRALGLALLSYLVPKRRGLFVFYPTFERGAYAGHLAPVFEALLSDHPEIDCLWLTNAPATARQLAALGRPVACYARYPLWTILRAEWLLLDSFAQSLAFGRFRLAQLWHGTGFKRIGLLNLNRAGLRRCLHRHHYGKYAFILAGSPADRRRKIEAFGNANVFVTGSPRNDVFFAAPAAARRPVAGPLIAYCPTFRDNGEAPVLSPAFWPALQALLDRTGGRFVVKRHPKDRSLKVPVDRPAIADVTATTVDVQQLLLAADVLITDYSSISTDFVLTGRPLLFFVPDLAAYTAASRSLYFDLETLLPGPFARNETELLAWLADLSWFDDPAYQARYAAFRATFHQHLDGGAAKRTVAQLLALR